MKIEKFEDILSRQKALERTLVVYLRWCKLLARSFLFYVLNRVRAKSSHKLGNIKTHFSLNKNFTNFMTFQLCIVMLMSACSYLPKEEKLSFENVVEETNDYILIAQNGISYDTCFVFVPGGLVDPHVYLCWLNSLVDKNTNFNVLLLKTPSNLAIMDSKEALRVMSKFPEINSWIIGGHSLGGVIASMNVAKNPDLFLGLVLMASWPTESSSLVDWKQNVLSISGSNDGLASPDDIKNNKQFLPEGIEIDTSYNFTSTQNTTYYFRIEGGNHSNFGCYGFQKGDNEADISAEEQQKLMIQQISKFIKSL